MKKISYLIVAMAFVVACGEADPHAGHNHAAESAASSSGHNHQGGITLEPEQAKELGVEWQSVEPKEFTGVIRTGGTIISTPSQEAAIVATASGIVTFAGNLTIGSAVNSGSKILSISSSTLTDDNLAVRIADAEAILQKAQREHMRIKDLYEKQLATAQQIEDANLNLTTAEQAYKMLASNTKNGAKDIASTIGGYITSLSVINGGYVEQGQVIATVSSSRMLILKAELPARNFKELALINSANFALPYSGEVYDIADLGGKLLSKGSLTNGSTLPIQFEIQNRASLVNGSVVDVFLKTATKPNTIVIPVTSITEEQGAFFVYLKTCTDTYEKRPVRLGASNGIDIEVVDGVKKDDVVVTRGAYFVRLASMSTAIPDGHNH